MIVTWAGWSTLHLDAGLRVLIDPCVSGLLGAPCAWSRAPVDAIVLTHGHHEHLRDLHRVLRDIDAPVWAPEPVIRWVTARRGVDRRRCTALEDGVEVSLPAGRLTPRAFPHLPKNVVAGKLAALWRRRRTTPWLAMLRAAPQVFEAHLVTRSQPEEGPYFALDLGSPPAA